LIAAFIRLPLKGDDRTAPSGDAPSSTAATPDHSTRARRLALIVLEQCAMAIGETCKLAWGDVDVAESKFRLRRSTVKGQIGARARWVQVPRWLMDAIEDTCPLEDRTADRPVFGGTPTRTRT
jgi:integrase